MKYQAYPEYKDSGVEWLEEIPKHWEIKKLKFIASVQPSNVDKKTDTSEIPVLLCNYTDVYYNDTVNAEMDFMKASATEIQINKFTLQAGDTIITKDSEDPNDIAIPAFVPATMPGVICGYHLAIIRPYDINYGAFIKRVFECGYARAYFSTRSNGLTRYGLGTYPLDNVSYPKPTKDEAKIIANFLNHETAKIDALIAKQQRLIELLKEKRQAVISHAVTKGLNPNVPMKNSGVEWLGEVPEHWELIPLKYLCQFSGGGTPSKENFSYWTGGNIPWVSPKDMKAFWVSDTQDKLTEKAVKESSTNYVENGALLMVVRSGILQRMIPIAINTVRVTLNQDIKALRFNALMNVEYAANFILGYQGSLLLEWSKEGATVESIEHEYLSNTSFPVPSIEEQMNIIEYVKKRLDVFQKLEERAINGITLLQERRTALISAAVTGKIDVRDFKTTGV